MVNNKKSQLAEELYQSKSVTKQAKRTAAELRAEDLLIFWEEEVKSAIGTKFESVDQALEFIIDKVIARLGQSIPEFQNPKHIAGCREMLSELVEFDDSLRLEIKQIFKL